MHITDRLNPGRLPDMVWDSAATEALLPAEVLHVTRDFNDTDYALLHQPLSRQVQTDPGSGISYALLSKPGDSSQTAVVHFNPFANGLSENMLLRAEYLRRVFRALKITDSTGRLLPVLTLASPSSGSALKLARHQQLEAAEGRLEALAVEYLKVVRKQGFQELMIIGFSQGASLATAAAAAAPLLELRATHLAIGEPANVMIRPRRHLARHFAASARHLKKSVKAGGITALEIAHKNESALSYILGILSKPRLNWALMSGLSKDLFTIDLKRTLNNGTLVTLGYGDLTTISPLPVMRRIVSRIRRQFGQDAIHSVEIKGGHHAWADQLNLLATFYAYALTR